MTTTETTEAKPKKRKNSKVKGNTFELKVAKLLSVELAPLNFIRVPNSGARVGGVNFGKIGGKFSLDSLNIFVGDVVAVNETDVGITCKVSIECKSYSTPDSFTTLIGGTSKIYGWMKESEVDAVKTGKVPVLIFKWNNTPMFLASPALPDEITKIRLSRPDGPDIKICSLEDGLKIKSFWF